MSYVLLQRSLDSYRPVLCVWTTLGPWVVVFEGPPIVEPQGLLLRRTPGRKVLLVEGDRRLFRAAARIVESKLPFVFQFAYGKALSLV